jgi:hypothetical protein
MSTNIMSVSKTLAVPIEKIAHFGPEIKRGRQTT